jgi:serine/threonine protein kinase
MDGGALLGQGTYGCVYSPPLLCNRKQQYVGKKGDVGKITEAFDIVNEITATNILGDTGDKYFILPNPKSLCHPSDLSKQPDAQGIKDCEFIRESDTHNLIHFTMAYGGVTVTKLFKSVSNSPIQLLPFTKHLLEIGAQLELHGYVHYDIHSGNVLIKPKSGEPRLIDFGMSFSTNNITNAVLDARWKVYSPDYSPEPPELTCIVAVRKNIPQNTVLSDMLKTKSVLKEAELILGMSRQAQLKKFINFWKSSKSIKENNWVHFFQNYWPSFDAWGIGVFLLTIIGMNSVFYNSINMIPGFAQVKETCKSLLCMNPRERSDCIDALSILDPENSVINSVAGKAWKKERDEIRAKIK